MELTIDQKLLDSLPTLRLSEMEWLQGKLKELLPNERQKLKESLEKRGFKVPFFIWQDGQYNWIVDGHQRHLLLSEEGFAETAFPVVFVQAATLKEAKELVLLISSRYGTESKDGFAEFMAGLDAEFIKLATTFDGLLDLDIPDDLDIIEEDPKETKELDDDIETKHRCPECGYEW
ncbi:ParB N-terminal domain-containing protein [Telluribacter humicola]|uniref:hypothetical protein n=1 Tax=Telluribacter humicola TaxID=1720261 RepID=UPI001A95859D|nr:hypothetical protein [Telluribacter humicola]